MRSLALAAVLLPLLVRQSAGVAPLLMITCLVQLADAGILLAHDNPGLVVPAGLLAAVPLVSAWWLRFDRHGATPPR